MGNLKFKKKGIRGTKSRLVTAYIPERFHTVLKKLVTTKLVPSISETIRHGIIDFLTSDITPESIDATETVFRQQRLDIRRNVQIENGPAIIFGPLLQKIQPGTVRVHTFEPDDDDDIFSVNEPCKECKHPIRAEETYCKNCGLVPNREKQAVTA